MNTYLKSSMADRKLKNILLFIVMPFGILAIIFLFSLYSGSSDVKFSQMVSAVYNSDENSAAYRIFMYIRLPRAVGAMLAGAALAVSGVIIQVVLSNPLASPNIIGVNSGAGFFAICAIVFFPNSPEIVPIFAFLGAFLTAMLVYLLSLRFGARRITIILSGVAIAGIMSAGIDLLTIIHPDKIIGSVGFMMGSFSGVTLDKLFPAFIYIIIALALAVIFSYEMNILLLGRESAKGLGVRVGLLRFILIVISSLLAGAAVSFAGLLGFVGLIVPHLVRFFTGNNHRLLVPCSAIVGASFVLLCDTLCRIIFAPYEVPVGIIMSFLGGPFFLYFLFKRRKSNA